MTLNRDQAIMRLCVLVTRVGEDIFKSEISHDCLCNAGSLHPPTVDDDVIQFIEASVLDAIARRKADDAKKEKV